MDFNNIFDLTGKVAIVTGGSRGIGESIAKIFSQYGARVVISSRKEEGLYKVAEEIRKSGGIVEVIPAHAGKIEDIKMLVSKTKERFGRIDILVNNAATSPYFGPVLGVDEKVWDKIMEVNLRGPFFLCKEVAPQMSEQGGGVIINIASVGGIHPPLGIGVYGISKAGLIMLTKVLAQEWAIMNIRVNAIAPGVIATKLSDILVNTPEIAEQIKNSLAMRRIGTPDEIAGTALFLASQASSYITGETIIIDGGGVMR